MRKTALLVLAAFLLFSGTATSRPMDLNITAFKGPEGPCVRGEPVLVHLELERRQKGSSFVLFGLSGILDLLEIKMLRSDGTPVNRNPVRGTKGYPGRPVPPASETYRLESGIKIAMDYDLSEVFDLSKPEVYTLILPHGLDQEIRTEIEVIELSEKTTRRVAATCTMWPGLPDLVAYQGELRQLLCNVAVGEAECKSGKRSYVVVMDIEPNGEEPDSWLSQRLRQMSMEVPDKTTVEKHVLDFQWCLWLLLKSEKGYCLTRWHLFENVIETVVDWTPDQPELSSTGVANKSHFYVGIGGPKGGPLLTTFSSRRRQNEKDPE